MVGGQGRRQYLLLSLVHKWHVVLDTPGSVIRMFLDFRKAYDLIDHARKLL